MCSVPYCIDFSFTPGINCIDKLRDLDTVSCFNVIFNEVMLQEGNFPAIFLHITLIGVKQKHSRDKNTVFP